MRVPAINEIQFTVYSVPVAQPRQRHRIVPGAKPFIVNYTPKRDPVQQYKYEIKEAALKFCRGDKLWEGPLAIEIQAYLPRPKVLDGKKHPPGRMRHAGKKDFDNLAKSVIDALTGTLYKDDGQICSAIISKWYHERDGKPRVEIRVWKLE